MIVLALLAQILAGWLLADFLSGLVHWLEDTFGSAEWPIVGPLVIAPNRLHHAQPFAFTRGGFWSRNSTTIAGALAIALPLAWIFGPAPWLVAATIGGMLANQVHYWAHVTARAPAIVRALQRTGVLQSPLHHQPHHAAPHDRRYCILTSWLNPLLDRVGFWRLLERPLPRRWFA